MGIDRLLGESACLTSFNDPEKEYLDGLRHELPGFLIKAEVEDQRRPLDSRDGLGGSFAYDFGGAGRICLL